MSNVEHERWHLKREIQIGHIITTVTVAASVLIYIGKLEQRIALIESNNVVQQQRDERQDKAHAESMQWLSKNLDKLDAKLDRLIEKAAR